MKFAQPRHQQPIGHGTTELILPRGLGTRSGRAPAHQRNDSEDHRLRRACGREKGKSLAITLGCAPAFGGARSLGIGKLRARTRRI